SSLGDRAAGPAVGSTAGPSIAAAERRGASSACQATAAGTAGTKGIIEISTIPALGRVPAQRAVEYGESSLVGDGPAQARGPAARGVFGAPAFPPGGFPAGQRQVLQRQARPGADAEEALRVAAAEGDARLGRVALDGEVVARRDDQRGRPEVEWAIGVVAAQR